VNNLFDRTYVSSAGVVADSPTDTPTTLRTTKQSFFAGYGRSVYGGITVGF
jgi:outer membrane receptor protein involved in Fe transport